MVIYWCASCSYYYAKVDPDLLCPNCAPLYGNRKVIEMDTAEIVAQVLNYLSHVNDKIKGR